MAVVQLRLQQGNVTSLRQSVQQVIQLTQQLLFQLLDCADDWPTEHWRLALSPDLLRLVLLLLHFKLQEHSETTKAGAAAAPAAARAAPPATPPAAAAASATPAPAVDECSSSGVDAIWQRHHELLLQGFGWSGEDWQRVYSCYKQNKPSVVSVSMQQLLNNFFRMLYMLKNKMPYVLENGDDSPGDHEGEGAFRLQHADEHRELTAQCVQLSVMLLQLGIDSWSSDRKLGDEAVTAAKSAMMAYTHQYTMLEKIQPGVLGAATTTNMSAACSSDGVPEQLAALAVLLLPQLMAAVRSKGSECSSSSSGSSSSVDNCWSTIHSLVEILLTGLCSPYPRNNNTAAQAQQVLLPVAAATERAVQLALPENPAAGSPSRLVVQTLPGFIMQLVDAAVYVASCSSSNLSNDAPTAAAAAPAGVSGGLVQTVDSTAGGCDDAVCEPAASSATMGPSPAAAAAPPLPAPLAVSSSAAAGMFPASAGTAAGSLQAGGTVGAVWPSPGGPLLEQLLSLLFSCSKLADQLPRSDLSDWNGFWGRLELALNIQLNCGIATVRLLPLLLPKPSAAATPSMPSSDQAATAAASSVAEAAEPSAAAPTAAIAVTKTQLQVAAPFIVLQARCLALQAGIIDSLRRSFLAFIEAAAVPTATAPAEDGQEMQIWIGTLQAALRTAQQLAIAMHTANMILFGSSSSSSSSSGGGGGSSGSSASSGSGCSSSSSGNHAPAAHGTKESADNWQVSKLNTAFQEEMLYLGVCQDLHTVHCLMDLARRASGTSLEWLKNYPVAAANAAAQEAAVAIEGAGTDVPQRVQQLLQSHVFQEVLHQTLALGIHLCSVLPVPCWCNNMDCSNLSGASELLLVGGAKSICAGCRVARYCSRECQAADWPSHKKVCKLLKAERARPQHQQ